MTRILGRRRKAAVESIRVLLVREFKDSTESWLAYRCCHCDAIKLIADKFGLDVDAIVDEGIARRGE